MALDDLSTIHEEKHKKRGMLLSTVIHITLIVIALLPLFTYPDPPPGQEGVLVNLGLPDVGQGDNNAGPSEPVTPAREEPEPEPEPEPVKPQREKPQATPEKEVVKTEDPEAIALRKKKQEEDRLRREEDQRRQREEAEQRRKSEEAEKARQAEEARKKAEADKLKNDIGGLFGSGKGKGNTGKPGNQGDPGGDPNADKLEGISTGSGRVGGGLGSRGVLAQPRPDDQSQATGTVVIEVCVDTDGNVLSADYTQRGSSTSNPDLVRIAVSNAKKWKFSKGEQDKQCGTITYNFRLR